MVLQINTAIIHGFVWSVVWMIIVSVSVRKFPWTIAHDYPKDVVQCADIPPPDKKQKRQSIVFFVCSFLVIIGTAVLSVLYTYGAKNVSFITVFFHLWIMSMTWNVVDLTIVDWLMICVLTSKLFIFPGTENCVGNKDYLFHFIGFLKGIVAMTLTAFMVSGTLFAVMRLMR